MNSNAPKVSFIPKSSLAHEGGTSSSRPKSFIAFIAITLFVVTVGVYGGLYYYKNLLSEKIEVRAAEIKIVQDQFTRSPDIEKAKVFSERAGLARALLDSHVVVSPAFDFLSENTVSSIKYENFTFKQNDGVDSLELKGEAPSYASLVNQLDILKKKQNELSSYLVSDVALTSFGTVTFSLKLVFMPGYLSYINEERGNAGNLVPGIQTAMPVPVMIPEAVQTPQSGTKSPLVLPPLSPSPGVASSSAIVENPAPITVPLEVTERAPEMVGGGDVSPGPTNSSFWSWFKFW